jgi:hypothetical protein
MMKFWWFCSGIGSVLGGLVLMVGYATATSAPQEAAVGALAVALAVVPYVLARSIQLTQAPDRANAQMSELMAALARLQRAHEATAAILGRGAPARGDGAEHSRDGP